MKTSNNRLNKSINRLRMLELKCDGKTNKMFKKVLKVVAATPIAWTLILLRPILHVRFGHIYASRLGHLCTDVENYIHNKQIKTSKINLDVLYYSGRPANYVIFKKWAEHVNWQFIFPTGFWSALDHACQFWSGSDLFHISDGENTNMEFISTTSPILTISKQEELLAHKQLARLGINPERPWVCIHNRDQAYLKKVYSVRNGVDAALFDKHINRNFSITDLNSSIDHLTGLGFQVIRMGSCVDEPLTTSNSCVFDYASSASRTELLDLFLLARCAFYFGSDSGISSPSLILRKPVSIINFPIPLIRQCAHNVYTYPFIFKKILCLKTDRFLTLKQILNSGLTGYIQPDRYKQMDLVPINNTPDEIRDLAAEVAERYFRLDGKLRDDRESCSDYQQEFWSILRHYYGMPQQEIKSLVGESFLKSNLFLLD